MDVMYQPEMESCKGPPLLVMAKLYKWQMLRHANKVKEQDAADTAYRGSRVC